ncbi:uncharacterized protein LOC123557920 isoform X2 [Mercenaria mercenaria]|uniref:uncharacterized protein LOC123557920 isoform X2 n=1 Tax=Mercenaria mercenaria TaxID=6596 RepID=UPI001E1D85E5|nr:uncharacterized protein LOC123557920 isoform X2 [Mercenaria mercenaria]
MNSGVWSSVITNVCTATRQNCRVNAVSTIDRRDVAQCKKKWICVVSQVKKLESARRTEAGGTGGGQPPVNMPLWQEVVLSTIPRCNVSGIDGGVDTADEDTSVRDLKDADDEEEEEGLSVFGKGASGSGVFGKSSSGSVKGKGLSGKPSVSGSQRSAGSSEELEQKRKFLEVEQERLQISKEQLKLKKKKNELLEKANELQTRTAEALEGILVVMREKQLNEILSESLLEC